MTRKKQLGINDDNRALLRTVEVFTGAYASGKSESAINRALQYANCGKSITLVDLDTVEPAYCLRPIIGELKEKGINIIAQTDYFGLCREFQTLRYLQQDKF